MIGCRQFQAHLQPYATGEVSAGRGHALGFHAASCSSCYADLASARGLVATLDRMGSYTVAPPAALASRIMTHLPQEPQLGRLRSTAWTVAGAAVMLLPMMATVVFMLASGGSGGGGPQLGGVQATLQSAWGWLQRFGALLETLNWLPSSSAATASGAASSTIFPAVGMIAAGLLGTAMALYLSTVQFISARRRSLT